MAKVVHFMRYPTPGVFSIERMYQDIRGVMSDEWETEVHEAKYPSTGIWNRAKDIWLARKHQGDINHQTGDAHYLNYLFTKKRSVLTIQDFVSLERHSGFKRFVMWFLWHWIPEKRAAKIVVTSHSTRKQLEQHLSCPKGKVRVIPINVSSEFKHQPKKFNAKRPRILQVGAWENKNVERVAEALDGIECDYVIIGRLSDGQKEVLKKHNIAYENLIDLPREAVLEQYALCDMMTFASMYEGFGLPIIEAQAVGRPVVTSTIWSMPEVSGGAASLVDAYDVGSIRHGIVKIIEDEAYREKMIVDGLENAKRFSISEITRQYEELYSEVLAEAGPKQTG